MGRWDDNTKSWVTDAVQSPCIDAGDPVSDWSAETFPHGNRINMGGYGGTAQASRSPNGSGNIADIDKSGTVDIGDLRLMAFRWLSQGVSLPEDLDKDGIVDYKDFVILENNWGWSQ